MVHPQPLEAALQPPQESVSRAIGNFGCEPHFLTAGRHHLADSQLAFAISVCIRRVQISNATINRSIECLQRSIFVLVHEEAAAASECQNRNFGAGSSQSPRRKRIHHRRFGRCNVLQKGQTRPSRGPQTNSLKKVSPRELFAHGLLLDKPEPRWHAAFHEFSSNLRSSRQATWSWGTHLSCVARQRRPSHRGSKKIGKTGPSVRDHFRCTQQK